MHQTNIIHPANISGAYLPDLGLIDPIAVHVGKAAKILGDSFAQKINHPIRQAFWAELAANGFNNKLFKDTMTAALGYTAMCQQGQMSNFDNDLYKYVPMIGTVCMWYYVTTRHDLVAYVQQNGLVNEMQSNVQNFMDVQSALRPVVHQFQRNDGGYQTQTQQSFNQAAMHQNYPNGYQVPQAGPAYAPPPQVDIFNNSPNQSSDTGFDVSLDFDSIPTVGNETIEMTSDDSFGFGDIFYNGSGQDQSHNQDNVQTNSPQSQGSQTINMPYGEKKAYRRHNPKRPYPIVYDYTTSRIEFNAEHHERLVEEPEMDIMNHAHRPLLSRQLPPVLGGESVDPSTDNTIMESFMRDLCDPSTSMPYETPRISDLEETDDYIENLIGMVCLCNDEPTSYLNAKGVPFTEELRRLEYMESVLESALMQRTIVRFAEDLLDERQSFSAFLWNRISAMLSDEFEECLHYNLGVEYYRKLDFFRDYKDVMSMMAEDCGETFVSLMNTNFLKRAKTILEFYYDDSVKDAKPEDMVPMLLKIEERLVTLPMFSTDLSIDIVDGHGKVDSEYFPHFYEFLSKLDMDQQGLTRPRNWLSFRDGVKIRIEKGWLGSDTFIISDGSLRK